jgi:hypothetical protein
MQNAHLRLARLEYARSTVKTQTRTAVHVSHFIGEGEQAHLVSFFGNDAEVGTLTAAIHENHRFDVITNDGNKHRCGFGQDATVYKANLNLSQQKRAIRHVVAISSSLHANGSAGKTFLWGDGPAADTPSWASLVSLQGLPAAPAWGGAILAQLREEGKLKPLFGVGCSPAVVEATREELMERIGASVKEKRVAFPEHDGPILWPSLHIRDILARPLAN